MEFADEDIFIYELLNGELVKKSAPKPLHQLCSQRIEFALETHLRQNPVGQYFHAPVDVFFDDNNGVQPDICFLKSERTFLIDLNEGIMGAPDLIMEIISPGSIRYDRGDKKNLYERFAVKEYWIIDPNNRSVEVFVMRDNAYVLHEIQESTGKITSSVLSGFEVEVSDLFSNG